MKPVSLGELGRPRRILDAEELEEIRKDARSRWPHGEDPRSLPRFLDSVRPLLVLGHPRREIASIWGLTYREWRTWEESHREELGPVRRSRAPLYLVFSWRERAFVGVGGALFRRIALAARSAAPAAGAR